MTRHTRTLATIVLAVLLTVGSGGIAAATVVDDAPRASDDGVPSALQGTDCSYPVTLTDTTGTNVTVEQRPERIVALQPSDAQILWEINASDRVVGMDQSATTDYLNGTEGITNVKNDDGTVDVEQVTNLSADVVLAANVTSSGTIDQIRNTGTPVYHFGEVSSFEEIYENVNRTGQLVGNCEAAGDRVTAMQERLDLIRQAVAEEERPSALYQFYGYTTGNDTHIHDALRAAGAENVGAVGGERSYYEISREIVVNNDPEWIVYPSDAQPPSGAPYNDTTALQEEQVLEVNTNYANQPGPRVVEVVETMAQAFHPDAFDENGDPIVETETATPTETATATETSMATESAGTTADAGATTDGSGPGFAPVTTLVALAVAAVALGARRKGV